MDFDILICIVSSKMTNYEYTDKVTFRIEFLFVTNEEN